MGSKITYEERTGANACELYYAYNNSGKLFGFYYDGASSDGFYYYKRNLQGDIIGILNSDGGEVVTYKYDTWGKHDSSDIGGALASTVGVDNPFRYRGYYYDDETGLYYLNQRYYNPEWGRFINADTFMGQTGGLLSHNVFAYCGNNPVMFSDPSGYRRVKDVVDGKIVFERELTRKEKLLVRIRKNTDNKAILYEIDRVLREGEENGCSNVIISKNKLYKLDEVEAFLLWQDESIASSTGSAFGTTVSGGIFGFIVGGPVGAAIGAYFTFRTDYELAKLRKAKGLPLPGDYYYFEVKPGQVVIEGRMGPGDSVNPLNNVTMY